MIQVTILLVRWQHWGDRSSGAALLLPVQPSSGAADPAPAAPDPAALNGTAMAAVAIPMYAAAAGNASAPIAAWPLRAAPGAQAHAVAYPRLHVLVLAFSIFASLVTAMQTAVMLAATNEDSAWKSRVMRSWTTFMLSCAFFFCDGYVHISSFASFATVFRQLVFLPLAVMIGTPAAVHGDGDRDRDARGRDTRGRGRARGDSRPPFPGRPPPPPQRWCACC